MPMYCCLSFAVGFVYRLLIRQFVNLSNIFRIPSSIISWIAHLMLRPFCSSEPHISMVSVSNCFCNCFLDMLDHHCLLLSWNSYCRKTLYLACGTFKAHLTAEETDVLLLVVIPSSVCLPITYPFPDKTICSKALLASLVRLHGSSHLRINRCAMGSWGWPAFCSNSDKRPAVDICTSLTFSLSR